MAFVLVRQEGGADRYFVSYSDSEPVISLGCTTIPIHTHPHTPTTIRTQSRGTHILNDNPQSSQTSIDHLPIPLEILYLLRFVVWMAIRVILCGLSVLFLDVAEVDENFVVGEDGGLGFDYLGGVGSVSRTGGG